MRIISLDPAGKKFGVAGITLNSVDVPVTGKTHCLSLFLAHVIETPSEWDSTKKTMYMAHAAATIIALEQPEEVVSEKPWGMGFSKQSLTELIGAIKAETWAKVVWQGVSEARRGVIGDTWGGSDKRSTAEWLLEYPWDIRAKRFIRAEIDRASTTTDEGYDILDAILHGVFYLIDTKGLVPRVKPKKERKRAKKITQ